MLARIADAVGPQPGDFIVEIGPGEGALTFVLAGRLEHLHVVELDRDLAAALRGDHRLTVHEGDALELDFSAFPEGMRLVGNLPYNVSTPLLFHFARFARRVRDMHFMLQLEVVERMVAAPSTPAYGRLSVALQALFRMQRLFNVAPGAFRPPPKVQSAMVRLVPRADGLHVDADLLRRAFSARRKTLRNALAGVDLEGLGIDPRLRPENLSPEDYARISASFR
ncbi:MAG TPA: 16S rRNA (adenine(1518)-N(6)/adenine(1519)-N(6))-dimethyltransferase RsmA [Burkholderiales bacterium]|nr:16S rRNA (adenine(1518)-N(6)/adenine(1519)-N(6))-dimethyltransferase RsmA [Burkholderiales bacterium]